MKFNSRRTFKKEDHVNPEINKGISITVPDEAMSLEDLLKRHSRGQEVTIFQGVYSMDNDDDFANILPEFDKMDRIERLHFSQELRQEIMKKRAELEQIQARKNMDFDNPENQEAVEKELKDAAKEVEKRRKKDDSPPSGE